jgi:hypothetical protein
MKHFENLLFKGIIPQNRGGGEEMEERKFGKTIVDFTSNGSIQCIAIAHTEKDRNDLLKRAYRVIFTPNMEGINCWVLFREKSESGL